MVPASLTGDGFYVSGSGQLRIGDANEYIV